MSDEHTLLLVDDEPAILSALKRTLRGTHLRILSTTDPSEALVLLDRESVDVLVSDVDMPHMSGLDLVARCRRSFPNVVRILLTGRGSLESALRAINDGEVYRFLTKPWDDVELRHTITEACARLDELRNQQHALRRAEQRRRLMAELEKEHPGISVVTLAPDGTYAIGEERIAELRRAVREDLAGLL